MASSLGIPSLQSELSTALALFKIDMGAFVVGTFMSTLVAGMILQHTLRYFRLFPDDPVYIKIWVVTVVTVQMFSCALYMYSCYDELVTNYANPSIFLQKAYWPATVIPIMAPVNYILAEAFFVRRVYTLGRFYRVIALFSMALITASLGFFIRIPISTIKDSSTTEVQNTAGGWEPTVGSALLLAGDLQLTAVLIYFLRENRSGIKRTNSMIDTLIVYAISSGSLICALNVVTLVLSLVFAHNSILAASSMVLETAYTSSFIVACVSLPVQLCSSPLKLVAEQAEHAPPRARSGRARRDQSRRHGPRREGPPQGRRERDGHAGKPPPPSQIAPE
ncbi:hypothetical protein C8Q77DRAFT_29497 [Trametes polyzona]|nr:hypothetical protein C8Q77DRAFT_29497 [Trametes polyzona]